LARRTSSYSGLTRRGSDGAQKRAAGYRARGITTRPIDASASRAIDADRAPASSRRRQPVDLFKPIVDGFAARTTTNIMVLADYQRIYRLPGAGRPRSIRDQDAWSHIVDPQRGAHRLLLLRPGTIREYADDIWKLHPLPVK
jgi:hypothetical protein